MVGLEGVRSAWGWAWGWARAGAVGLVVVVLLAAIAAGSAQAARVAAVSPSGEAAEVRQVVVRFDAPLARAGDPRQSAPFTLQCEGRTPAGAARWLDPQRWAYDLAEPLGAGQRCTLRANPAFQPPQGMALVGPTEFRFATGAPVVIALQPHPGSRIEEDQHFLLQLNGEVDLASVQRSVWCEVEGALERVAVRIVVGAAREQVIRQRWRGADPGRTLLLECERPFPAEAGVRLVWGAGVAAASPAGTPALVSRTERRWQWKVRPRLLAEFSCERERANAPCMPLRPLLLRFNAPVQRAQALAARLQPVGAAPGAAAIEPKVDDEARGEFISEIRFAAPLPENMRWQLTLPAALRDDAGRPLANAGSFPLAVATGALPPLAKFAGAPFGIVEAGADPRDPANPPLLPLTLRHVQADIAGARSAGRVSVRRIDASADDATLLGWIARVQRWQERSISAKDAGLPEQDWLSTTTETDARGRARQVRQPRLLGTREVSLLAGDTQARRAELPQLVDPAGAAPRATEVIGVPLPARGYHVVEIESRILGHALLAQRAPMYVRTGALVTNLGVHFKKGRSSSLVWVTALDRGAPVAGAKVAVNDCNGKLLWSGATGADGIARIERGFAEEDGADSCATADGLFVSARKAADKADAGGDDVSFVFSRWQRGIEPWRFNLPTAAGTHADRRAHTVLDRTLLRVGETVSMKHFVRVEGERALALPPPETLPDALVITHAGSGNEVVMALAWPRGARAAESRWTIPRTAALGLYELSLRRGQQALASGSFRVEAFRVPLVDARLAAPPGVQVAPAELAFAAQINAMAGGPMPGAALELSALLRAAPPRWPGYEDFAFEPASSGRARQAQSAGEGEDSSEDGARVVARRLPARTDRAGAARIVLPALPALAGPSELVAELAFDDPNGEKQTVTQRVKLWPSAVVVGLRLPGWAASRGDARLTAVVLDTEGRPLRGRAVEVSAVLHQTFSTRKRIVGGFYAYDNQRQSQPLGRQCGGRTDAQGRLHCDIALQASGEVELIATARDDAGRSAQAAASVWVSGGERWWFAQDNDDRIDLLPEKRELEPGQTARVQVRMPFARATALVTVEREGVIDARVLTLSGREPVIELPIPKRPPKAEGGGAAAGSYAPNVVVSVLVLRGRLREAPWWSVFTWGWRDPLDWWRAFRYEDRNWRAPTALVDLAKPSFKFGAAMLDVGLAEHRLEVQVTPDKAQYGVREKVQARVRVSQAGQPLAGAEIAFAAVDEGLLALAPNASWDLLNGLWRARPWGVETATAAGEIVGRRHYGRKALPPGGGGGRNPTRELFDTLLLWRGTVALDARGEAVVEVPLNDSLTSFRLVAIADDGAARFGTGSASVRVTQELQLLSGLAPLVRQGDRIDAGFTLRNTTPRAMNVKATLAGSADGTALAYAPQTVALAAGAATELRWSVDVPAGAERIDWEAAAEEVRTTGATGASGTPARDRVKLTQAVASPVPLRVWQATLMPLTGSVSLPLVAPAGHLPGHGGVRASLQPSLAGALPGLRRYFETYPYSCLEQKTARAIGLRDAAAWALLRDELAGYLDADGLAQFFPPAPGSGAGGSDRLTAHLLASAHEAGWAWPDAARERMLQGLAAFVEGRLQRRFNAPRPDLEMRKLSALEALARHGRAEPRMLGSIVFTPAAMTTWPSSALLDAWSLLERMPALPDRAARLADVQRLLRARLVEGGSTLKFSTETEDDWWWLLESADGNAARLLLAATASPAWKDDVPRIVAGTLARQQRGAWRTTTANLWGVLALEKFAQAFERDAVTGRSVLALAGTEHLLDWSAAPQGGAVALALPAQPAALSARHEGGGRPWLSVQTLAAVPLAEPLFAGYRITRSVSAVQRKLPDAWSRGDLMRVRIEVQALADFNWVVISDPVPAGATLLGSGLARDSGLATRGEKREGSAWPSYEERAVDAWRAYYEWLPRGRHVVEYTLRLNSAGRLHLPPTRVEAMYAPENFGELPLAPLEVRP